MSTITRGSTDHAVTVLKAALDRYEADHPGSKATLYRQNSGSVRVRVVDDGFAGMNRARRHDAVWAYLEQKVEGDTLQEVSVLLLMTPDELNRSLANLDFEDPIPSDL